MRLTCLAVLGCLLERMQSLTIANSRNVVVAGVRSVDSELFHVVVLQCHGVTVRGVTVEAPADSPNTDGIHMHMSSHVSVYDARISTGDDCISIGPGNSHLWIERVACGPGHGIRYVVVVSLRQRDARGFVCMNEAENAHVRN